MITNNPRILFIDDESELVTLASSFFEDECMPIDTCTSFAEAMDKIKLHSYDLIISDARMPSGSGRELLDKIKADKIFHGKFILLTGNLDYQHDVDKNIFDLILFKPMGFQEVIVQAKKILSL
jgi:CheY-like chemotaxis protein